MRKNKWLWDAYQFPGFRPEPKASGVFGDPHAGSSGFRALGTTVSPGFAEGLNNNFSMIKRRSYGFKEVGTLHLKTLTHMLLR